MNKKQKAIKIIFIICCSLLFALLLTGTFLLSYKNKQLREENHFEPIKEGLCVYVEYEQDAYGREYTYCLVYDYDTEKVIEVDLYEELIHTDIYVGDTILYVVDYNYTDADFVNVIRGRQAI